VATTIGTTIDAVRTSVGRYKVTFHSLAAFSPSVAGQGGTVQVVAVGPNNVRCTLASNWKFTAAHHVVARVACRAPGGGPADSGFFAYFGRGPASSGASAYARVAADASVASATQYSSAGSTITANHPGTGTYWVFINAASRQQVQVTAVSTKAHCHAALRELGVTTVRCFNNAGAPVDAAFTINQAGTDGLALYGAGAFAQVGPTGSLDTRYDYNSCGLGETTASRIGVGRYSLSHTLVGTTPDSYLLSAYVDASNYCKVDSVTAPGGGTTAAVIAQCYSATGAPQDSGLVESYAAFIPPSVCQPTTLATSTAPSSVAANDSTVWFTNHTEVAVGPGVVEVPRSGGASTTLATGANEARFDSAFVTPDFVYWHEAPSNDSVAGILYRKPVVGGKRTLVQSGGLSQPRALALVAGDVYVADAWFSQVWRIDSTGTSTGLWDSSNVSNQSAYPHNIAADGARVYFVRDTGDRVQSVPLTGGDPTLLSSLPSGVGIATSAIATDGAYVYCATDRAAGDIFKVPVAGGSTTTFASAGGVVTGLAVFNGNLYWSVRSPGKVVRMPLTGADSRTLASSEDAPSSIFVDAGGVLWTTAHAVRLLKR
jgi:sugar lactone lactonase YvrE